MRHPSEKILLIMLALLLILSPLQSLMAGFSPDTTEACAVHGLSHANAQGMTMDHEQAMNPDCQQCNDHAGCDGHGCIHTHCASCFPGMLTFASHMAMPSGTTVYLQTDETYPSFYSAHPFRPPKG